MTKEQRLKVVESLITIMRVTTENMHDKKIVLDLFDNVMLKNINIKELQKILFKFVEGEK